MRRLALFICIIGSNIRNLTKLRGLVSLGGTGRDDISMQFASRDFPQYGSFSPKIVEKKKLSKSVSGYYKTKKKSGMDHKATSVGRVKP